ncbi:DUF1127 domain-containing protein [Pontivivens nitratireducens]|nr:DUF1127 domain-containing protein [Pontibrevibacter nitratireducens]
MAFVTATDFNTENTLMARITAFAAKKREAFVAHRVYRKTVNELSALSGSELADLGLTRGSIHATAHRAVYGN